MIKVSAKHDENTVLFEALEGLSGVNKKYGAVFDKSFLKEGQRLQDIEDTEYFQVLLKSAVGIFTNTPILRVSLESVEVVWLD
jgi:hypothetical protein